MIKNFEEHTTNITDNEIETGKDIIEFIKSSTSKSKPVKSKVIEERFGLAGSRIRKVIHYFRSSASVPVLSTSRGYYYSTDKQNIRDQITSLRQRARSIDSCADGLQKLL